MVISTYLRLADATISPRPHIVLAMPSKNKHELQGRNEVIVFSKRSAPLE